MQEIVCLLKERAQQLHSIIQANTQKKDLTIPMMKFEFNEQIRTHQQKKILTTFMQNTSSTYISEADRDQFETISNQYVSMSSNTQLNVRLLPLENDLQSYTKHVIQVCRAVLDEVRTKILNQTEQRTKSNLMFPLTSERFESLLENYAIKVGLLNQIELVKADKTERSMPDILIDSTKANNKVMNSIKQYASQYKSYLSRLQRRRVKKMALEAAQKKAETAKQVKNITPLKKIILQNSLNAKCRQFRKEKVPLPQALKKIEFPFLASAKTEQPLYLALMHKKATKKIYTIPSQHISHNPSIYVHNAFEQKVTGESNILACEKLDLTETPIERIHLTTLKQKIKEEMRRREDKGFGQSNFFNDDVVKRGADERLSFSNKRFS